MVRQIALEFAISLIWWQLTFYVFTKNCSCIRTGGLWKITQKNYDWNVACLSKIPKFWVTIQTFRYILCVLDMFFAKYSTIQIKQSFRNQKIKSWWHYLILMERRTCWTLMWFIPNPSFCLHFVKGFYVTEDWMVVLKASWLIRGHWFLWVAE